MIPWVTQQSLCRLVEPIVVLQLRNHRLECHHILLQLIEYKLQYDLNHMYCRHQGIQLHHGFQISQFARRYRAGYFHNLHEIFRGKYVGHQFHQSKTVEIHLISINDRTL